MGNKTLTVYYIIEYEDECNNGAELALPPLKIVITNGQTALHVLENAVHTANDTQYQFTATFYVFGYHVHTINGTSDTFGSPVPKIPCYWTFWTKKPSDNVRVFSLVGVTQYVVPADNYTIIMRYTNEAYSPPGDSGRGTLNTSINNLIAVVLLSIVFLVMFG